MRSDAAMTASTPTPISSVSGLVSFRWAARTARRCSIAPSGAGNPRTAGNCEMTICTEMPARKPVVTGIDSRSAIQPRRKIPAATRKTPTISASAAASIRYSGEPAAAIKARPPAKIGVIVESAPHDRYRLPPKAAKASEPARKANKPICGVKPPSRAVAICSGMAIAASVSPATRSRVKKRMVYDSSERNTGQGRPARDEPESSGEPEAFTMRRSSPGADHARPRQREFPLAFSRIGGADTPD